MAPGVGIVKTPRVPVPQGFGIQAGGTNAGWCQRAEHFRAANGTYAWVAYNWDNVLGNSGSGRAPARIIRNYQMPDDSFGQYRMFVEGVWCLNYYQLLEIDPDVDEKLPAGLVVMMKKDASIHIESNWKVLLEFESVITDAEVRPVRETEIASQQQPVPRMQVAACDPDYEGEWDCIEWEECMVLKKNNDATYDVRVVDDGEECLGVPDKYVREVMQVAQCDPDHSERLATI